jgi:hypothetical protein
VKLESPGRPAQQPLPPKTPKSQVISKRSRFSTQRDRFCEELLTE